MITKILVVDDEVDLEVLIKQKFRRQIRNKEFEFVFAINGVDALAKLKQHEDIDIVLSDINMPEMDGLTLLSKITELSPLIKTVIISAYGDMENIRSAMNKGAYDFICKPVNFDDLETTILKTIKQVLQIKETVRAIKENNILRMYVDETVLNFMNREEFEKSLIQSDTVNASVVFIDICQFTAITENENPDFVVSLLNRYFDLMVKEILTQNGYIDKFIGDAIMAVFRGEFHLDKAIDASLAVRKQIEGLSGENENASFSPKVSIGINSGEMISGNIGSESLRRFDFTVIGEAVNLAQALQTAAGEGQILITESSFQQVKESFNCRKVGEVNLKNKKDLVTVYEVLG
jgi:adenylate cyclase